MEMDGETIEPEFEPIKKEYEIKIENNKLKIVIDDEEIEFILLTELSYYKYIKRYKYEEIANELGLLEYKDIKGIYEYLKKCNYKILTEDKTIIINENKFIKLKEIILADHELMQILINEIKELKNENNTQNEKINELIQINKDKDNKFNELEMQKK
jgi:hypothetical protein